jgi:CDP-6-deoxy-D-xylo-4-hexulose-3-dehydrase
MKKKYFYPLSEDGITNQDISAAKKVLNSKQLTMSKYTREFEKEFSKKIGARYALMVNSGSSANLLAVFAAGNLMRKNRLKPGDEVILPILCWPTSLWPLVQFGLKPVFVDIDKNNLNILEDQIKKKITRKTKAIMLINVLGNCCDLSKIKMLAKKYKLIIFEDNCESLGSKYKNKNLGTFGDFGTFSFFYSHQITSGEGGMVTCNNEKDYEILFSLRSHGWLGGLMSYPRKMNLYNKYIKKYTNLDPRYIFTNSGFNLRPMDLNASIGLSQFRRLNEFIKARKKNRNLIISSLKKSKNWNDQFSFIDPRRNLSPSWMVLPVIINKKFKRYKKKFLKYLDNHGVETRPIISGSFNNQPAYKLYGFDKYNDKFFPNSQFIEDHGFVIGLHKHNMKKTKIDKLVNLMMNIDQIK